VDIIKAYKNRKMTHPFIPTLLGLEWGNPDLYVKGRIRLLA